MNELVIDSRFNFTNDPKIINSRVHSMIQELEREIKCYSSYINVKNVFEIIVKAKPHFREIQDLFPNFTSTIVNTEEKLKGVNILDLEFFEKKMILISLVTIFENFTNEVLLLGAFYYPERARNLIPDCEKGEMKTFDECVLNNRIFDFESLVKKRLSFKHQAKNLKNAYRIVYGIDIFPSEEIEEVLLDLVKVRNIIVHQNAIPKENDFNNIKFKNVIKKNSLLENLKIMGCDLSTNTLPNVVNFSLNLFNNEFDRAVLNGMGSIITHFGKNILSQFFNK